MSTPIIPTFADDYGIEHLAFHDTETGTQTEVWEYGSTGKTIVFYRSGTLEWATNKNGRMAKISFYGAAHVFHCVDGPAIIEYGESEHSRRIRYYQHGQLHRIDAPAEICYHEDGNRESEAWYLCGQLDHDNGLAIVEYNQARQVRCEEWYWSGRPHRLDGPAVINYDPDGYIRDQQWCRYRLPHRTGDPALMLYDKGGQVASEVWFKNGYLTTTSPSKVRGQRRARQKSSVSPTVLNT